MNLANIDLLFTVRITSILCAFVIILSSLEYLKSYHFLSDKSYLSWDITKYNCKLPLNGFLGKIVDKFFSYTYYKYTILLRLLSAVLILLFALYNINIPSILYGIAAITTISLIIRGMYGLDGSYHLNMIIITCLFLYSLFPQQSFGASLCIYFIAIQGILSYLIAGITKLQGEKWRNGKAIIGIFGTKTYGNQIIYNYMYKRESISLLLAWFIIFFEIAYVFVLVVPFEYKLLILFTGICFHAFNSLFMGLNSFFFSFLSAYPSILFLSIII
ncbi:hypothetical protein [Ascidiimonas aurantiaca]|uniref:hypothetical protein n=1 Tax=Ascidiimonas aurantiaca TaxID=1685432 RepID=UPI0030EE8FCB